MVSLEGEEIKYSSLFAFKVTNNVVEYKALVYGLRIAKRLKVNELKIFSDSKLMENQVLGDFDVNEAFLVKYHILVTCILEKFDKIKLIKILTEKHNRGKISRYTLIGDKLYKKSFTFPYLKCLEKNEANYVMREIHEKCCGHHIGEEPLPTKFEARVLFAYYEKGHSGVYDPV